MFTNGGVGLFGFADGSEKSIFFDDIQVVQIPEPKPLLLLIVSTSLLLLHVRERTARQGENYG